MDKLLKKLAGMLILLLSSTLCLAQGNIFVKAAPSGPDVSTTSSSFVDIPDLSITFTQHYAGTVCIGMAAECEVSAGKRMFVRALVDGQPAYPSDVVFKNAGYTGTHSFVFNTTLDFGPHTVTMQYLTDSGGTAFMGDRTMWVMTSPPTGFTIPGPSGPDVSTTSSQFVDIPHMIEIFDLPEKQDVVVTLTAEAETSNNKRMFVRALIDGQPLLPSDVVFAVGSFIGTHSMTFVGHNIDPGPHEVKMQWLVDSGGTAFMGDRTMTVGRSFQPALDENHGSVLSKSAPSGGAVTTSSSAFSIIPDMVLNTHLPHNSAVRVSLSSECYTTSSHRMFVQALIDGQPMLPSDVLLKLGAFNGTNEFTFVKENIPGGHHEIVLQWLVDAGGTASMGDRNITLTAFPEQSVIVDVPNGGESWEAGTPHIIVWRTEGIENDVRITYSTDGGNAFMPIVDFAPNTGTFTWDVPNTPSPTCIVQVADAFDHTPIDESDAPFTISMATGLMQNESSHISNFYLYQNYPDPFNPTTTIAYDLPHATNVQLNIYDALGRKIKTLVNSYQTAGHNSVTWDATNRLGEKVTTGLYFCRMQADDYVHVIKLLLTK